jgi:hypothetical protein
MKGLALESIAYIVLALVSIFLIIGLVTGRLGPAAKSAYCKFLRGVKSILPMPSHLKTTMPVYCAQDGNSGIESHEIVFREPERVAYELAAYSIACWEKTGKINVGRDTICYEISISNIEGSIDESTLSQVLIDSGYSNFNFQWDAGTIDSPKVLSISYLASGKTILLQ